MSLRGETTYIVIQPNDFTKSQLIKSDPDPSATQKWKRLGYSLDQFKELVGSYVQVVTSKYADLEDKIIQVINFVGMTPELVGDSVEVFSSKTSQIMMIFIDYYSTPHNAQTFSIEIPEEDVDNPEKLQQHMENYYKKFARVATEPLNKMASIMEPSRKAIHGTVLLEKIKYPIDTLETIEDDIFMEDLLNTLIDEEEVSGWVVEAGINEITKKCHMRMYEHTFKYDIMGFSFMVAYDAKQNRDLHDYLLEQDRLNHTDVPGMEKYDNSNRQVEYTEDVKLNVWMTEFLKPMMNGNPFFGDAFIHLQEINHFRDLDKETLDQVKKVINANNYEIKEEDYEQKRDTLNRQIYNSKYRLLYKYANSC
jgi:hypothetical protein